MAAIATSSSPPTDLAAPSSTRSPRRKPVALHNLSPVDRYDWGENAPSQGGEPPLLRRAPSSPVNLEFHPDNWIKPSNADIETLHSDQRQQEDSLRVHVSPLPPHLRDRDLPPSPLPPTPPPHTPRPIPPRSQTFPDTEPAARRNLVPGADGSVVTTLPPPPPPPAGTVDHDGSGSGSGSGSGQSLNRQSRESSGTTESSSNPQASTESSATTTSASSVSCVNETTDTQDTSGDASADGSVIDDAAAVLADPVAPLQYHHSVFLTRPPEGIDQDPRAQSDPELSGNSAVVNHHLTPNSHLSRTMGSIPRPQSSYSLRSARGASPAMVPGSRVSSAQSRKSPDARPSSYAELLNVPYPQSAPAPITFDNSQLRSVVGSNASLLSAQKTLEMYRQNVKKTSDFSIQYSFAVFLISTAQEQGLSLSLDESRGAKSPKPPRNTPAGASVGAVLGSESSPQDLVREAKAILQKLANSGYPFAQYYLADGYASGLFSKGKEDYNTAFPLFVLAAKHGHAESAFRTALSYEFGWGCRRDPTKSIQFLRSAASKRHPGAMTRLGRSCLLGDLGEKRYREGIKWLKLAAEAADAMYNAAPYHLGCLYETGYGDDIFKDEGYAAELFTQAAELGNAEAAFRMGDAYEHGKLSCPRDPALSVHFYTSAADRGHAAAMMGLCAWYMVGAEPLLEKDEEEACEWARRSAELGSVKAQYAIGYFTEMGIGCRRDILEANVWYVKAADAGDDRAKQRLAAIHSAISGGGTGPGVPMEVAPPRNGAKGLKKGGGGASTAAAGTATTTGANGEDNQCTVM